MNCKNKSFMTKKKAFTLIELLIVIAIIGILFIVLVSKVDFATDKAKATGVQTDFRSFQMAFDTVAKENAGFNTFGWDTGDTNGDRIRNSYDKGDTNQNGIQDSGEVFVGSKTYGETWTGVYTFKKPGTSGYDADVIAALEAAINKNLDPKLHITIDTNGNITMANGAQDPWNKEYHGYYITNADVDGKDRGAIIMYSDGANNEFGSEHSIAEGIVEITVPGNNVYGQDDMSIVSVYTYVNGYGETQNMTTGFSNNQHLQTGSASKPVNRLEQFELTYYGTLQDAFNSNNSVSQADALVATYINEGKTYTVLLKDLSLTSNVVVPNDMNLDLNGKSMTFVGKYGLEFNSTATILASESGSSITSDGTLIKCNANSNVTVIGGKYSAEYTGSGTSTAPSTLFVIAKNATLTMENASITGTDKNDGTIVCLKNAGTLNMTGCNVLLDAEESLNNEGISSTGTCVLRGVTIIAKSDYTANASGKNYASRSRAIVSDGASSRLEMYDCYMYGTHSGVTTTGQLLVDGGTYEGYGHGGIYIGSPAGTEIHIKNAALNWADMLEGTYADSVAGTNGAGLYIGMCSNVSVYFDNCTFNSTLYGIVLRGSSSEKNNAVYLDNCTMTYSKYSVRISSYTSTIYIGKNNNFTAATTSVPGNCVDNSGT